jgi:hypothetical protein
MFYFVMGSEELYTLSLSLDSLYSLPYPFSVARQKEEPEFQQLNLEGFTQEPETIVIEHCIITNKPTFRTSKHGNTGVCAVYAPPILFAPEREETYQLHATTYADEAKKKRLKPGDVVTVTGTLTLQQITLQNGTIEEIKRLAVSDLLVVSRSPRKTVTVYETRKHKRK